MPSKAPEGYDVTTIAQVLGITPTRVQQLVKEDGMPQVRRGHYNLVACVQWYIKYWRDRAEAKGAPGDNDSMANAKLRQARADARLAEIELAQAEGELLPLAEYEKELGAICDRIRGVLSTVPSKYLGPIQLANSDLAAQAVGEQIRDETLAALQESRDDQD